MLKRLSNLKSILNNLSINSKDLGYLISLAGGGRTPSSGQIEREPEEFVGPEQNKLIIRINYFIKIYLYHYEDIGYYIRDEELHPAAYEEEIHLIANGVKVDGGVLKFQVQPSQTRGQGEFLAGLAETVGMDNLLGFKPEFVSLVDQKRKAMFEKANKIIHEQRIKNKAFNYRAQSLHEERMDRKYNRDSSKEAVLDIEWKKPLDYKIIFVDYRDKGKQRVVDYSRAGTYYILTNRSELLIKNPSATTESASQLESSNLIGIPNYIKFADKWLTLESIGVARDWTDAAKHFIHKKENIQ